MKGTVLAVLAILSVLLSACGGTPVQGAWEARIERPAGSNPTGVEVHLTLAKFLKDEQSGAAEYTIFYEAGRIESCLVTLKAVSRDGGVFEYEERTQSGPCVDGGTVRVTPHGEGEVQFERVTTDGSLDVTGVLETQHGVATAKGKAGA